MLSFYQQIDLRGSARGPITTIENSLPLVRGTRQLIAADDMYVTYCTQGKFEQGSQQLHFIHIGFKSKFEIRSRPNMTPVMFLQIA